jgi:ketosteroid isomerase-like protein
MMRRYAPGLLALVVLAGCNASPSNAPASAAPTLAPADATPNATAATSEVLERHMKTFGAADLEGVMADYAPTAVMLTPGGPIAGTEALRKNFQAVLAEWSKPGTKFTLKQKTVEGEHAFIAWDAETADNIYEGGMDGFVVRDGKIVAHFFSGKITPKSKP